MIGKGQAAGTDSRNVYIVGGGIAGLSAAVFAVRDAHIAGENIHVLESTEVLGGAMDGSGSADTFYVTRGDRKVNKEVFNCLWDVLAEIPSPTAPGKTVKEEIFDYNSTHRKDVKGRLIDRDGKVDYVTTMGLDWGHRTKTVSLILTPESRIENRRIDSWFSPSFFKTNFWKVFSSMFAIEQWNDLGEMRRYLRRFMHGIDQMVKGTAEMVTPHHNYDSIVVPIIKWLNEQGVDFQMGCKVTDLDFKPSTDELTVERLHCARRGEETKIAVGTGDYVFATVGSMTADSTRGSMTEAPGLETGKLDGSWTLWENIAAKRPGLGNPFNFSSRVDESKWPTFVVTAKDPTFLERYERFTGNKPGQADMVTFRDSAWHMSVLVPHHPHFLNQPDDVYIWGGCGLVPDATGDFVKKRMSDCNGEELLTEVCHQFGFVEELPRIIETSTCIPQMMPYEMSHFLTRKRSDRPPVIPAGSTNLAFMGQFTESGECVMLVESSVRCGMIAVYSLLGVDREVPALYSKVYSPRAWLRTLRTVLK
ncbi:MAG: oleate hydratase [Actinomycetota bacterium]